MNQIDIDRIEKENSNTSKTNHHDFDRLGCLVIQNIFDVTSLRELPPNHRGQFFYKKNEFDFSHAPVERQVEGSLSRYNFPKYKEVHLELKKRIENIIGKKLFPTYYYDRYYFNGQQLTKHLDRDSCEISLSLHIASNPENISWPFYIKTAEGFDEGAFLSPGDGLLYKGCERPHWRNALDYKEKKRWKLFKQKEEDIWYHQIFFHYVLADGYRLHFANDRGYES